MLLIDNLDLVLDRLADSLWELREALSIDNRLAVIGASSKFVEEAIDYESPLYDFFHVHELGPLSEEESRQLVLSLARRAGTPRVAEVLERDPGRFKALCVLTGGTPRTLAVLYTVLALEHHDRIERDLDGLLDQLTPYYKARFDDLPAQSQVIVDKVALHWHPITAAECQAATHLYPNIVSAQLSRLAKSGLLTKVDLPEPSKLGFQISERFFNIWYLMRASRRLRRRLAWFVETLRTIYGEEDLRHRAEALIRAAPQDSVDSPAKLLAFASAITDEALRRRLEFRAIRLLAEHSVAAIRDVMDLEGEDVHLAPVIDRVRALREIRQRIARAKVRWPSGQTASSVAEAVARDPIFSVDLKRQMSIHIEKGDAGQLSAVVWGGKSDYIELGDRLLSAISCGELPPFSEVRTSAEIQQILDLAKSRRKAIVQLMIATERFGRPLSDDLIRGLLSMDPLAAETIIIGLGALVGCSDWLRIRHLMLLVARQAGAATPFEPFIAFLGACVSANLATEALELLGEAGLAERWAPLHEALRAVAEGSPVGLDRLAPEMRVAAVMLSDQLRERAGLTTDERALKAPRKAVTGRRKPSARHTTVARRERPTRAKRAPRRNPAS